MSRNAVEHYDVFLLTQVVIDQPTTVIMIIIKSDQFRISASPEIYETPHVLLRWKVTIQ